MYLAVGKDSLKNQRSCNAGKIVIWYFKEMDLKKEEEEEEEEEGSRRRRRRRKKKEKKRKEKKREVFVLFCWEGCWEVCWEVVLCLFVFVCLF